MSAVMETVTYRCACGAEIEWRLTEGVRVVRHVYVGLAEALKGILQQLGAQKLPQEFRIHLRTKKNAKVVLVCRGGSNAVSVSDGESTTYGTFALDSGEYRSTTPLEGLTDLLLWLSSDFRGAIQAIGVETDQCPFCGHPLTDPRSTHAGYGPVCAVHYGLDWP